MTLGKNWSVGHDGEAGDFVWVSPHKWRVISKKAAQSERAKRYDRVIPLPLAREVSLHRTWENESKTFGECARTASTWDQEPRAFG